MICIENIHKSFGNVEVLKGIDLQIEKAEIVSIVGKSGAGKTTLLQIVGTLLKADSGLVTINGTEVSRLKEKALSKFRNRNLGFVFQNHQLLPEFTALENVMIPGLIAQHSRKNLEQKAREVLEFLNLGHRMEHKPKELSGGEQQRVAVARALINDPEVILADEPSGNLDTQNKEELHQLFFTLRDTFHQTFIIVTHDMALAKMSDRTVTMQDGKILNP
ncbi:MAG: lipoprotein-releasing system ATP-binding protein LolD [Bacteroidetes bacterium HGW-Bacteroidetes-4]|jgi:lipoprotein-releasing system ATP-binding protein|nr:MAG: lipoprotein-releasing system ATP-binding protein LolD [Bacteroidetes bacterium HGW-Bacteroidetes-4]